MFWCTDTACTETEYSLPIATGKIYSRTLVSIKSTGILSDVQKWLQDTFSQISHFWNATFLYLVNCIRKKVEDAK